VAVYFVETSALAKRYIAETGSEWLRALLDPSTGCSIYVVRVTAIEIIAAITRRERSRTLAPTDASTASQAFRSDLAAAYQVIEETPALADRAMLLAEQHGLRGYDAMQLAAGCEVHVRDLAAGLPDVTFISADTALNTAAIAEGSGFVDTYRALCFAPSPAMKSVFDRLRDLPRVG
jgi:predicted nucleic acid-binding protein